MKAEMRLGTLTLVVLGCCFSFTDGSLAESFYDQVQRTVIRLEVATYTTVTTSSEQEEIFLEPKPAGTAFFVGHKNDFFVVTARHVVDLPHDSYARGPVMDIRTGEIKLFRLELPRNRWQFHSNHGDSETRYVDVAVMKISSLDHQRYLLKCLRYNPHELKQHDFFVTDILPPSDILIFGFPLKLGFDLKRQCPLGRFGIVAMTTDEKFLKLDGKYLPSHSCPKTVLKT